MANAEQGHNEAVPLRLGQHAVTGVDENDCQVARAGTGRHVPRVLLVARRVRNDELALGRREIAIRHVNRDALLAFRLQAVGEQRRVEVSSRRPVRERIPLQGGELVLVDHFRVVEQPADERTLAVIHAAARQEPQQFLLFVLLEVGVDIGGDKVRLVGHGA